MSCSIKQRGSNACLASDPGTQDELVRKLKIHKVYIIDTADVSIVNNVSMLALCIWQAKLNIDYSYKTRKWANSFPFLSSVNYILKCLFCKVSQAFGERRSNIAFPCDV